jgi:phosphoribosylformylglycinamidine synthase
MIVFEGLPALSPYRRDRLEARLRQIHDPVQLLESRWLYFVDPDAGGAPDQGALGRILEAVPADATATGPDSLVVVPRLGTISPWAS